MTTTNLYSGIGDKNSSRVLKPPGGGHSNIFGEPDACPIKARPKNNQQNSSNMAHVVGSVDANEKALECVPQTAAPPAETGPAAAGAAVEKIAFGESSIAAPHAAPPPTKQATNNVNGGGGAAPTTAASAAAPQPPPPATDGKPRVPPGGFSSGFW